MRESIVKAWDLYFKVLKQELVVCCFNWPLCFLYSPITLGCTRKNFLHGGYLVNQSLVPIPGHWIHRDWSTNGLQLCTTLIVFHCLWGSHNGARLARIVLHLLDQVGITVKACPGFIFFPISTICLHLHRKAIGPSIMPHSMVLLSKNLRCFYALTMLISITSTII